MKYLIQTLETFTFRKRGLKDNITVVLQTVLRGKIDFNSEPSRHISHNASRENRRHISPSPITCLTQTSLIDHCRKRSNKQFPPSAGSRDFARDPIVETVGMVKKQAKTGGTPMVSSKTTKRQAAQFIPKKRILYNKPSTSVSTSSTSDAFLSIDNLTDDASTDSSISSGNDPQEHYHFEYPFFGPSSSSEEDSTVVFLDSLDSQSYETGEDDSILSNSTGSYESEEDDSIEFDIEMESMFGCIDQGSVGRSCSNSRRDNEWDDDDDSELDNEVVISLPTEYILNKPALETEANLEEELDAAALAPSPTQDILTAPVREIQSPHDDCPEVVTTDLLCTVSRVFEIVFCCGVCYGPPLSNIKNNYSIETAEEPPRKTEELESHIEASEARGIIHPGVTWFVKKPLPFFRLSECDHKLIKTYTDNTTSIDVAEWKKEVRREQRELKKLFHAPECPPTPCLVISFIHPTDCFISEW